MSGEAEDATEENPDWIDVDRWRELYRWIPTVEEADAELDEVVIAQLRKSGLPLTVQAGFWPVLRELMADRRFLFAAHMRWLAATVGPKRKWKWPWSKAA